MLDFVLGIGLAALAVRGWLRGFVREVLDLVSLVLGFFVAFLLSAPLGDFLSDRFGVSPEVARIGSGILLFVLFGVAMSIAAHFLAKMMRLPGLNLLNRIGGSVVAVSWGILLVLVLVNVVKVLPLLDGYDEEIEDSTVVEAIAGEDALPQQMLSSWADYGVLDSLNSIQSIFGASRVVPRGNEVVIIPPVPADEVRQVRAETDLVLDLVNEERAGDGIGALFQAPGLTAVAESRAATMYQTGRISRDTPAGRTVGDELVGAGIRLEVSSEVMALAATSRAALDALFENEETRLILLSPQFDRAGVSIVEGPTGVLLLIVLGG